MSKKVIECEYCHTLISEDDVKCPECGANCSNVIKKYRKEQEEKQKKEQEQSLKTINAAFDAFNVGNKIITVIFSIIFIAVFIFIIIHFVNVKKEMDSFDSEPSNAIEIEEDEKEEKITIGYKETGESDGLKITLDGYELFEYHADNFESYNTPKGYQKIAFHFVLENVSEDDKYLYKFIDLTADYSPVDDCKTEITRGFDKVVKGKEKYETLNSQTISSGQTLKGYLGFVVPKDKKELNFIIGNLTIKMDNPAYKK